MRADSTSTPQGGAGALGVLAAPGGRGKDHLRAPRVMPAREGPPGPAVAVWWRQLPLSIPSQGFPHPLPAGIKLAGTAMCQLSGRWWQAQSSDSHVASVSGLGLGSPRGPAPGAGYTWKVPAYGGRGGFCPMAPCNGAEEEA